VYDAVLGIDGVEVVDGSLPEVGLDWSPDPGAVDYEPIPSCDRLESGDEGWVDGDVFNNAILPNGQERGWCFYDFDMTHAGDQLFDLLWRAKGIDDPGFRFR
jgi:hypothetical protein